MIWMVEVNHHVCCNYPKLPSFGEKGCICVVCTKKERSEHVKVVELINEWTERYNSDDSELFRRLKIAMNMNY